MIRTMVVVVTNNAKTQDLLLQNGYTQNDIIESGYFFKYVTDFIVLNNKSLGYNFETQEIIVTPTKDEQKCYSAKLDVQIFDTIKAYESYAYIV